MAIQTARQNNRSDMEQRRQGNPNEQLYSQQGNDGWPQGGLLDGNVEPLSKALGWFSIGLGLAQLAVPHRVAEWIGVSDGNDNHAILRAVGLRGLTSGIGILSQSRSAGWMKARVGGDVMDLAFLGTALNAGHAQPERITAAMAAVAGLAVLDLLCTQQLDSQPSNQQAHQPFDGQPRSRSAGMMAVQAVPKRGVQAKTVVTVNCSAEELYQFWHNFENLPRFMSHLEAVQVIDEQRSHWRAKAPAGTTVEWDAEIVDDRPNELIAWRSLENADVPNTGSVRFAPATGGRGTTVTVEFQYAAPGGVIGAAIAKLFGEEPEQQAKDDLRAFKQVIETGEVVRSDGTLWGPRLTQRPAQPPKPEELIRQ